MPTTRNLIPFLFAALPLAYAATLDVTVGGPGILKYSPEFVVSLIFPSTLALSLPDGVAFRMQTLVMSYGLLLSKRTTRPPNLPSQTLVCR